MPLLFKLENSVSKISNLSLTGTATKSHYTENKTEYIADKFKHDDILSLLRYVNKSDEILHSVTTQQEETLLSIAVYRNSVPLCKALIDKGCDVKQEAKYPPFYIKLSPLSYAVTKGNIELVKFLLENGCNPTDIDELGRSAVQCAICSEHIDILKLFLERGCDPNTRIPLFTLLHEACYRGNYNAVKVLLQAGADPNLYEFNDRTIPAFQTHKIPIHKLLLQYGSDINWRSRSGETILNSAVYLGHADLVEFLLQNGALMNFSQVVIKYSRNNVSSNIQHKNLFEIAYSEEHFNICLILIKHGYQINIFSKSFENMWLTIASLGNKELAKILIKDNKNEFLEHHRNEVCGLCEDLKSCIKKNLYRTQSLLQISRNVIRKCLSSSSPQKSIHCKMKEVQCVPPKLIDYVMYR